MKLIRFGPPGAERPGLILLDGRRIDASGFGTDYDQTFFESDGLARLARWGARAGAAAPLVPDGARLGPPLCWPSKIICIGLNYRDHARETGQEVPKEPVIFFKATSAICGPNDDVVIPKGGSKLDWEVELAVVLGRRAAYVERDEALGYVAGYVLHNDYSERAMQLDPRAGVRRADARELHQSVHDAPAGRHHLHGHPGGRRVGAAPAALPRDRRRGGARHRRARLGAATRARL